MRSLFFRFAPRIGDRSSSSLQNHLISLGRLDPEKGWPSYLPEETLGKELRAYEAAYRDLLGRCEGGKLTLTAVASLDALRARVKTAVPTERGFRTAAERYVGELQQATRIFDASTIDFAQEMIRDTHEYKAQTVAELLAFMRKYRLLFASAEARPEDGETYRVLHGLLRQQKKKLNLPAVQQTTVSPAMSRAIDTLLIHLNEIATDRLPTIKQAADSARKKAGIDEIIAESTALIDELLKAPQPSDRGVAAVNRLVGDLRSLLENPDPSLKLLGPNVERVQSIIRTLEADLRSIRPTQRSSAE